MSHIKIHQNLPQGVLPQKEKGYKKTFFSFLADQHQAKIYYTDRLHRNMKKTKRKKEKGSNLNSLGSASRAPGDRGI